MSVMQENLWLTVDTGAGKDAFRLEALSGEERLSGLFRFDLDLVSTDPDIDFSSVLGEPAAVTVELPDGGKRYFHGIVTRFRQGESSTGATRYYAEIRPWLWLLTQTSESRIFQNKAVPDIAKDVFDALGQKDYWDWLSAGYEPFEYRVQYRETSFEFISRIFEDAGISYFFDASADEHRLVLADDQDAFPDCPAISELEYRMSSHVTGDRVDVVYDCMLEHRMVTGAYAVDDFNFETPTSDLFVKITGEGELTQHAYPGGFSETPDGEKRARLFLESHEASRQVLVGSSHCPTLSAGHVFSLSKHPRSDVNGDYVLRSVVHSMTQGTYTSTFEAIPVNVPFRPPRTTPKPVIAGTQTAIVAGKSGEEIWTDKYGRIKVRFHWDTSTGKDEDASCWVRVAQGWAGKSWGSFFLPRVGQEVVVSFLEGDPDRPLVTGSVYNALQTVPYPLPAEQTKSTIKSETSKGGAGFNEIRFEDLKESEEIYVHAQKDMNTEVLNDQTLTVAMNRTTTIEEGDLSTTVTKGMRTTAVTEGNDTLTVGGEREVTVTGEETHTNEAGFTQEVSADHTLTVSGSLVIDVSGDITLKAGGALNMEATSITSDASTSLDATAGTSLTNEAGTSLKNKAGLDLTNEAGTDLTNKAGTSLTNEASLSLTNKSLSVTNDASVSLTNKGGATHTAESSGILSLKGTLVKVN